MKRIKVVGLALVALFAFSAVAAAAASAHEFISKPAPQSFTAGQTTKHIFTVEGKSVECSTATFTGEAKTEKTKEQLTKAKYEGCTAFGFLGSTVNMNKCEYNLNAEGTTSVTNCGGTKIEVNVNNGSGCKLTIGEQTLKGITYKTVVGKNGRNSIEVKIAVKEIATTSNGAGLGCPAKKENAKVGEYTGTSVAEGATGTLEWV